MSVGTQDQTVFGDQRMYLFATRVGGVGSVKLEWRQTGGEAVHLEKANTQNPSFVAPRVVETTPLRFEVKATDSVGGIAAAVVRVIVDVPPLAVEAGSDMVGATGHRVTLHGATRGFYRAPTLTWVQTAGPAVTLPEGNVANPSFDVPEVAEATVFSFELTATDDVRTGKDVVSVRVDPTPLIVDASDDQTVGERQIVALHAAASGAPTPAFSWTQTSGPPVSLVNGTTANPTFQSPVVQVPTTFEFEVTAEGAERIARDRVAVVVQPSLPVAFAGIDTQAFQGSVVNLAGEARGGVPPYEYLWTQTSGALVQLIDEATATPKFNANAANANTTLTFRLSVTDSAGHVATDDVNVVVEPSVTPGSLSARAGADATIEEGASIRLRGLASGGTAPYAYAWRVKSNGGAVGLTTSVPVGVPTDLIVVAPAVDAPKVVTLELKVTDSTKPAAVIALDEMALTIVPVAFSVNAGADRRVRSGDMVRLQAYATGSRSGLGYTWTAVSGPSTTLVGNTTSNPSFVPTTAGTYVFRVTAKDKIQTTTDDVAIAVAVDPPAASAGADMKVSAADRVRLHAIVAGGALPLEYAWTLEGGPTVTLDGATTDNPSFVAPTVSHDTVLTFALVVSDASGAKSKKAVRVTISVPQLTLKTGEKGAVPDNQNVSFNALATGGEGPYTYAWRQTTGAPLLTLTAGGSNNPSLVSPALTEDTTFEFAVSATDRTGSVANATTHLTITRVPPVLVGPTKSPSSTFECGNIETRTSCSDQEIATGPSRLCPPELPFAMTDVVHQSGARTIYKRCVDGLTCETEWFRQTSERSECRTYDPNTANLLCHFCCTTDDCNVGIRPAEATLWHPN